MSILDTERPVWLFSESVRPACQGRNPEWWFPAVGESGVRAKEVCADCPLLDRCREYAIGEPGLDGVWGGLSPKERAAIRVEREIAAGRRVCGCGHHELSHRGRFGAGPKEARHGRCGVCDCTRYAGGSRG